MLEFAGFSSNVRILNTYDQVSPSLASGKNRAVKKAHIIVSFFNSIDSTSAVPLRVWYYQWVSLYFLIAIASTSIALSRSSCLRT